MRILLVANTLPPRDISGAGEQVLQLAAGLRQLGHEVEVLGRGQGGASGPKVLFPLTIVPAAWRVLRRFRPRIVQLHESDAALVALLVVLLRRFLRPRPRLLSLLQVSYREEIRAVRPLRYGDRVLGLIALHVPIGIAMGFVGMGGFAAIVGWGPGLSLLASEPAATLTNLNLAVIPLFMLMGNLAAAAGLANDVYNIAHAFIGHRKGGLATATVLGCGGFGAVCGSGVATTATFGRVALPEMLERGYSPSLATGATLGMLAIPEMIFLYRFNSS